MVDKLCIVIDAITFGKVFDDKMKKPAGEALTTALRKNLSSKATIVDKAGKDTKGLRVSVNVASLGFDDKKSELSATVKGVIAQLPEDKYLAGLNGGGKVPGANAKKLAEDVTALMESIGENFAGTIKKSLSSLKPAG